MNNTRPVGDVLYCITGSEGLFTPRGDTANPPPSLKKNSTHSTSLHSLNKKHNICILFGIEYWLLHIRQNDKIIRFIIYTFQHKQKSRFISGSQSLFLIKQSFRRKTFFFLLYNSCSSRSSDTHKYTFCRFHRSFMVSLVFFS